MKSNTAGMSSVIYILFGITAITSFYNMPITLALIIISLAGVYALYRFYKIYSKNKKKERLFGSETFCHLEHNKYEKWVLENHKGHSEVVKDLFKVIAQRKNLFKGNRPFMSVMLSGPTGTGKTYLAQLVSEVIYKNSKPLDINMGRFKSPASGKSLCEMIITYAKNNSPCLFILNEIDKCHSEVLHSLYTLLDNGKIYDSIEHSQVDLSICTFIATSNYGEKKFNELIEKHGRVPERVEVSEILTTEGKFEKSFIARFDAQYILPSLKSLSLAEVVMIECCKYWQSHGLKVEYLGADLIMKIITKNENYHEYGVRELERIVRESMDSAVLSAKKKKAKKIKLVTDGDGVIKVKTYVGRRNAA